MRKQLTMSALLAGAIMLGGCAYGLGDGYGYNDGYGDGYGGSYGGNYGGSYGYSYRNNDDFERAAVNACGREASQYGRIQITYADQRERGTYTVQGDIQNRDPRRDQFTCEFSSSGRIIDFRLG